MNNKKGFTLTEMIVVLVILAVLAAFTIPTMLGYISSSQEKLCDITRLDMVRLYKTSLIGKEASASKSGFETFAKENWGSLSQCPAGGEYIYNASLGADGKIIAEVFCSKHGSAHVLTADDVTMGTGSPWWKQHIVGYTGSATDIIIPGTLDGVTIIGIYQGAFKGKSLSAVSFDNDSQITRIHREAFMNNNLTEIEFLDSVTHIDGKAFYNNSITKITLGSGVVLEEKVFADNEEFKIAYTTAGSSAGTYVYSDGEWTKQT